jgi:hypothetical protein
MIAKSRPLRTSSALTASWPQAEQAAAERAVSKTHTIRIANIRDITLAAAALAVFEITEALPKPDKVLKALKL